MDKQTTPASNEMGAFTRDARDLMAVTAEVAGERVGEARRRLAAALAGSKQALGRVKAKAVEGARVTDEAMREHPYQAIGFAFGVGALLGYLASRRCSRNGD